MQSPHISCLHLNYGTCMQIIRISIFVFVLFLGINQELFVGLYPPGVV